MFIQLEDLLDEPAHLSPDPKHLQEKILEFQTEQASLEAKREKLYTRLR